MLQIIQTNDGSPSLFNHTLGVTYHSRHGALQESRHVFIHNGLHHVANTFGPNLSVFELGFGTGLNAVLSAHEAGKLGLSLHYTSIDIHPLDESLYRQLPFNTIFDGSDFNCSQQILAAPWQSRQSITPAFSLQKIHGDMLSYIPDNFFHLVYFDAFDPETQPDMWQKSVFEKLFVAMHGEGVLVTYCAKGKVKRLLRAIGFEVQTLKGPPGKREMTRAIRPLK
jgi:tRNA U34 5-methylaminomethyl-2-thiouridine-forming methyltransferase MnmC